jgi:hypothetical protein
LIGNPDRQQLPPTVPKDHEPIEQSEPDRRHNNEIDRRNPVGMVAKKRLPAL